MTRSEDLALKFCMSGRLVSAVISNTLAPFKHRLSQKNVTQEILVKVKEHIFAADDDLLAQDDNFWEGHLKTLAIEITESVTRALFSGTSTLIFETKVFTHTFGEEHSPDQMLEEHAALRVQILRLTPATKRQVFTLCSDGWLSNTIATMLNLNVEYVNTLILEARKELRIA